MGGYTAVAEVDGKVFFGTDYQGGTNFVVTSSTGETFDKAVVPDPYRRSPIMNMVPRRAKNGNELWASLPYSTAGTKCLLMYTADAGRTWHKVIEYSKATHKVGLINSSNNMSDVVYLSIEDLRSGIARLGALVTESVAARFLDAVGVPPREPGVEVPHRPPIRPIRPPLGAHQVANRHRPARRRHQGVAHQTVIVHPGALLDVLAVALVVHQRRLSLHSTRPFPRGDRRS